MFTKSLFFASTIMFSSLNCQASTSLTIDEQEWVDQYAIVKTVADQLKMPVKIRVLRGMSENVTPAALDFNQETGVCTLIISPTANTTANKMLYSISGSKRADRILAMLAHEYGHCVAYKTGFTKPNTPIEAKDEAYSDIFSLSFMSIARPDSYNTVMKMWTSIRSDSEVTDSRYSSNWIKYSKEIWASQDEPNVIAATYAIK